MYKWVSIAAVSLLFQSSTTETRVIEYLKAHVTPGRAVVVSDLYNNVFKTPEERKVLDHLYSTFFKIPMLIVQYNTATKKIPTLKELSEQFNFTVPGEANVILRIMESDPRVPKFIERNPKTGGSRRSTSKQSSPARNSAELLNVRSPGGKERKRRRSQSPRTMESRLHRLNCLDNRI